MRDGDDDNGGRFYCINETEREAAQQRASQIVIELLAEQRMIAQ
jgi:hypothetical protein